MYDNSRVVDHGAVQPPCRVQGGVSPDYNLRLRQQEALLLWAHLGHVQIWIAQLADDIIVELISAHGDYGVCTLMYLHISSS